MPSRLSSLNSALAALHGGAQLLVHPAAAFQPFHSVRRAQVRHLELNDQINALSGADPGIKARLHEERVFGHGGGCQQPGCGKDQQAIARS